MYTTRIVSAISQASPPRVRVAARCSSKVAGNGRRGPPDANEHICPACHRIRDQFPAGYVTLAGSFFEAHKETILQLMRNEEERAKAEHPLERIIDIQTQDAKTIVRTTDLHLARRLGDAVHSAYQGELEVKYSPDEYLVRVYWSRSS